MHTNARTHTFAFTLTRHRLDDFKESYRQAAAEKQVARRELHLLGLKHKKDQMKLVAYEQKQESLMTARNRAADLEHKQKEQCAETNKLRIRSRVYCCCCCCCCYCCCCRCYCCCCRCCCCCCCCLMFLRVCVRAAVCVFCVCVRLCLNHVANQTDCGEQKGSWGPWRPGSGRRSRLWGIWRAS